MPNAIVRAHVQAMPIRRRALFTALAGVGALLAAPRLAHAAGHPDAALLALRAELDVARARENAAFATCGENDVDVPTSELRQALDAAKVLVVRIHALRATTLDGLRAKALAIHYCRGTPVEIIEEDAFGDTTDARVAAGIVRDLLSLGEG